MKRLPVGRYAILIQKQIQVAKTPFLILEAASQKPVITDGMNIPFTIDELKQVLARIKMDKDDGETLNRVAMR